MIALKIWTSAFGKVSRGGGDIPLLGLYYDVNVLWFSCYHSSVLYSHQKNTSIYPMSLSQSVSIDLSKTFVCLSIIFSDKSYFIVRHKRLLYSK